MQCSNCSGSKVPHTALTYLTRYFLSSPRCFTSSKQSASAYSTPLSKSSTTSSATYFSLNCSAMAWSKTLMTSMHYITILLWLELSGVHTRAHNTGFRRTVTPDARQILHLTLCSCTSHYVHTTMTGKKSFAWNSPAHLRGCVLVQCFFPMKHATTIAQSYHFHAASSTPCHPHHALPVQTIMLRSPLTHAARHSPTCPRSHLQTSPETPAFLPRWCARPGWPPGQHPRTGCLHSREWELSPAGVRLNDKVHGPCCIVPAGDVPAVLGCLCRREGVHGHGGWRGACRQHAHHA